MPPPTRPSHPVVIDLVSDDSSDDDSQLADNDTLAQLGFAEHQYESDEDALSEIDGDGFQAPQAQRPVKVEQLEFSEQDCVDTVLEMFPDIAHEHVRQLYRAKPNQEISGAIWCQSVIEQILDAGDGYPREKREERKRKRGNSIYESEEPAEWENPDGLDVRSFYNDSATKLLQDEFVDIPVRHIKKVVIEQKTLFRAYRLLETQNREHATLRRKPFTKLTHSRIPTKRAKTSSTGELSARLAAELAAAKEKAEQEADQRIQKERVQQLEEENELEARATGAMAECGCCFTESPINRMIYCSGDVPHLFCYDCAKQNVATDIGSGKCRPKCMDQSGCKAEFTRSFLQQILDPKTFEKLERMQQEEDLRLAELDDVESCPFCEFKAVCPPVHVDKEFRCRNKECEKVSCRLCHEPTHIPKTCEEMKKEKKLDVRHLVEEAMTDALVRSCNKCKNKFIKEFGCNKMTCPSCRNVQCYVCNQSIRNYDHFGPNRCPLHDNTDQRHQDEVKRAEEVALAKVRAEHPELNEEDIKIKVSARVQQAEAARIQQGQARAAPAAGIFQFGPLHAFVGPPPPAAAAAAGPPNPAWPQPAPAQPFGAPPPAYPGLPGYFQGGAHMPPPPPPNNLHFPMMQPPQHQPYFRAMGIADPIGARVAGALGNLYAANQRVQHELHAAERQLNEQRARVQQWQDDLARYELEARRRRHF